MFSRPELTSTLDTLGVRQTAEVKRKESVETGSSTQEEEATVQLPNDTEPVSATTSWAAGTEPIITDRDRSSSCTMFSTTTTPFMNSSSPNTGSEE